MVEGGHVAAGLLHHLTQSQVDQVIADSDLPFSTVLFILMPRLYRGGPQINRNVCISYLV